MSLPQHSTYASSHSVKIPSLTSLRLADIRFDFPKDDRSPDTARRRKISGRVPTDYPRSVPETELDSEEECSWSREFDEETAMPEKSKAPTCKYRDDDGTVQRVLTTYSSPDDDSPSLPHLAPWLLSPPPLGNNRGLRPL